LLGHSMQGMHVKAPKNLGFTKRTGRGYFQKPKTGKVRVYEKTEKPEIVTAGEIEFGDRAL